MGAHRWARYLTVLLVTALVTPLVGVPTAFAASSFTGGPTDTVLYVPNDHTPIAFRFRATAGLSPSTQYYVKVRFTVGTSPNPTTNRGFTWNAASGAWVPDLGGGNWTDFPVVTSNSDGTITEQWIFAKFGDELSSGAYHVMISLFANGTTYNSSDVPAVTVMNMATEGGWIHNGTTIAAGSAGKRVECTSIASTATVYALAKTELDLVDSDSDGTVDNEDYGPAGVSAADFRLGVPVGVPFNTYINRTTQITTSFTLPVADTDIVHTGADQVAPSAPGSFLVKSDVLSNELSWTAASDSGGSGLASYRIVRRVATETAGFSNPWSLIATPTAGTTSYVDDDLEAGVEYFYEIRAVDTATNIGPRASGSGTPLSEPPVTVRTSGADRYATAIAISESTFAPDSVSTAILATGMNFPDALAASGLAGAVGSPVLLVGASVTASLTAELDRLGVTDVVIVGGESAVSASVATQLAENYTVDRIAGSDRYITAAYVASRINELTGNTSFAFFARGDSFADALAVSPIAYSGAIPVLLVRPSSVPTITSGAIGVLGVTDGVVAGSEAAVSSGVYTTLDGLLSGTIQRVGGTNRYDTAKLVAEYAVDEGWATYSYIGLATGLNYPDALGGCAATAWNGGVLLLTDPNTLSAPVASAITDNKSDIGMVEIYGGTSAVSQGVFDAVEALLN